MRRHIPNIITCCNLLCGVLAVCVAAQGKLCLAYIFIVCGAVFDFFDGFTARLLKVSNPIGKELDSLADVVTFGVAPAVMAQSALSSGLGYWSVLALLMAAFSALRLAKFNLDERQTSSFIGLATPANAIFWASLSCFVFSNASHISLWLHVFILAFTFLSCYLLVSEIPFFSLKMKRLDFREYRMQGLLLLLILVVAIVWSVVYVISGIWLPAGAVVISLYILINLIVAVRR